MELRCELSPLVYAELYRLLAADKKRAEPLAERLGEIGFEHEWLAEAAEMYEAKWKSDLSRASSPGDLKANTTDHALLASWVLAGLRATGPSYDVGTDLRTRVTTRAKNEIAGAPADLPSRWCPTVVGWTLGMVVGTVDRDLPVAPALLPADPNVQAAYEGLVEHVLHLGTVDAPWPEMLGTATFWRGTGLAEGLRPEAENGAAAIRQLIFEVRYVVPDHLGHRISQHFAQFAEQRNTLSHVADMPGKPRFIDVKEFAREWNQIRLTIMGITQFLCQQVSFELTESAARAVRPETWDELQWELVVYD